MSKKNDLEHTLGSQNMKSSQRMVTVVEPYELPEGWTWCRLGDVAEIARGGSPRPIEKYLTTAEDGINWIKIGDTEKNGKYIFATKEKIIKEGLSKTRYVEEGDFLLTNSMSFGRPYILKTSGCIHDGWLVIKQCTAYNQDFLYYLLSSSAVFSQFVSLAKGSTVKNLKSETVRQVILPLPPTLAEQQRIVNRIESMFTKLDEAKEKAQNVVDGFETRKAAILHKAFNGKLTANWRKENGIGNNTELDSIYSFVQSLTKKDITNIAEFQSQATDYILSDGTLWKKCCIGAIGIVTNGSTPSRKEPSFWNGDIPWVSSGEVSNNIIEATNECITEEGYNNSSVKKLPIGTVLIAMIGEGKTRGQTSVLNIDATTNQNIAAIIINHGHVEPRFLWYWLQKEYKNNRTAGNGSGPQALNCQRVRELPFILPSLPEQQEIVCILDTVLEKESRAKEAAQTVLDQIALLKKSILARAFRGKL